MASPTPSVSQTSLGTGNVRISWSYPTGTNCVNIETSWGENTWVYYSTSYSTTIANPVFNQSIYWVRINAFKDDGTNGQGWSNYNTFSLSPTPPAPSASPPSNITISYSGMTATVSFTKGSYASYTVVEFNNGANTYYPTGTSQQITVPAKGVSYPLRLASVNSDGVYSSWVTGYSIYVAPAPLADPPYNISVTYNGMDATISFTRGANTSSIALGVTLSGSESMYYPSGNSQTITLPARGVSYSFRIAGINADNVYSSWVYGSLFISARPASFPDTLYSTDGSGNDVISAYKWNMFLDRVNEFRVYKGYSNYSYSYKSSAVAGNDFRATYFNELISAMSSIAAGLPSAKSAGDTVYKSDLDLFVTKLNSIA